MKIYLVAHPEKGVVAAEGKKAAKIAARFGGARMLAKSIITELDLGAATRANVAKAINDAFRLAAAGAAVAA